MAFLLSSSVTGLVPLLVPGEENLKWMTLLLRQVPIWLTLFILLAAVPSIEAKFDSQVTEYVHTAYQHYKPIGVASTGHPYIQASQNNNLAGVVFAANNTDFGEEFVSAIAEHRFWNRT